MNIHIVIPFFNEEKYLREVVEDIKKYKLPVVLVNDGSTDKSLTVVKNKKNKNITILSHGINLGKGAAMKTGADFAFSNGADAVIFMDSDRQHEAGDILKFIEVLKTKKYDAVFGSRNYNYGVPLVRFLGNKVASVILVTFFGIYVTDVLCGFKAFTKKAYKLIRWDSTGYSVETEMIVRVGKTKLKFCEVPIESIYHDKTKGVTLLDAFGIMGEIIKWRFTI